jgi:hypothetical protein
MMGRGASLLVQIPAIVGYGRHSGDAQRENAAGEDGGLADSFQKPEEAFY